MQSEAASTHVSHDPSMQCAGSHGAEYEQACPTVQLAHPHGGTDGQSPVALAHASHTSSKQWAGSHATVYAQSRPAVQLAHPHGGTDVQSVALVQS